MQPKPRIAPLALLVTISAAVQGWMIARSVVPAPDSIRYVAAARRIEADGWLAVVRQGDERWLFPALVELVHSGAAQWFGEQAASWATSVQVAAALPLVLAVVPVYLASLRIAGRLAAFAGTLLFCVMTEAARLGADGLADSLHLLGFASAIWALVEAVRAGELTASSDQLATSHSATRSWLFLAGLASGFALLARLEGAICITAVALCLPVYLFLGPKGRACPQRAFIQLSCYACGLLVTLLPLVAVRNAIHDDQPAKRPSVTILSPVTDVPVNFAAKETSVSSRFHGLLPAIAEFAHELAAVFQYWVVGLLILGTWRPARRPLRPIATFALVLSILYSIAVIQLAAQRGYLATRHLLPLVVIAMPWVGLGIGSLARLAAEAYWRLGESKWLYKNPLTLLSPSTRIGIDASRISAAIRGESHAKKPPHPALSPRGGERCMLQPVSLCKYQSPQRETGWGTGSTKGAAANPTLATAGVVLLCALACLPRTLAPLHASRIGHRLAAEWLASAAEPRGAVLDTRGWTGLYTARSTYRYDAARRAFADPLLCYVVVEEAELHFASERSRTLRLMLDRAGKCVARFSTAGSSRGATVLIYRWNSKWSDSESPDHA